MLGYDGRNITTDRMSMTAPGKSMAALIGTISCGEPLLEEENVEKYIPLPKEIFGDGQLFILRANGDSMTGAGIESGDYVVVRKQTDFEIGDIVVALVDNSETTLKGRQFLCHESLNRYVNSVTVGSSLVSILLKSRIMEPRVWEIWK